MFTKQMNLDLHVELYRCLKFSNKGRSAQKVMLRTSLSSHFTMNRRSSLSVEIFSTYNWWKVSTQNGSEKESHLKWGTDYYHTRLHLWFSFFRHSPAQLWNLSHRIVFLAQPEGEKNPYCSWEHRGSKDCPIVNTILWLCLQLILRT